MVVILNLNSDFSIYLPLIRDLNDYDTVCKKYLKLNDIKEGHDFRFQANDIYFSSLVEQQLGKFTEDNRYYISNRLEWIEEEIVGYKFIYQFYTAYVDPEEEYVPGLQKYYKIIDKVKSKKFMLTNLKQSPYCLILYKCGEYYLDNDNYDDPCSVCGTFCKRDGDNRFMNNSDFLKFNFSYVNKGGISYDGSFSPNDGFKLASGLNYSRLCDHCMQKCILEYGVFNVDCSFTRNMKKQRNKNFNNK